MRCDAMRLVFVHRAGLKLNVEKSMLSFQHSDPVQPIRQRKVIPWCGLMFDSRTGQVSRLETLSTQPRTCGWMFHFALHLARPLAGPRRQQQAYQSPEPSLVPDSGPVFEADSGPADAQSPVDSLHLTIGKVSHSAQPPNQFQAHHPRQRLSDALCSVL